MRELLPRNFEVPLKIGDRVALVDYDLGWIYGGEIRSNPGLYQEPSNPVEVLELFEFGSRAYFPVGSLLVWNIPNESVVLFKKGDHSGVGTVLNAVRDNHVAFPTVSYSIKVVRPDFGYAKVHSTDIMSIMSWGRSSRFSENFYTPKYKKIDKIVL